MSVKENYCMSNVLHFTFSIVKSELEVHELSSKYNLKLISNKYVISEFEKE